LGKTHYLAAVSPLLSQLGRNIASDAGDPFLASRMIRPRFVRSSTMMRPLGMATTVLP
jgi:hypothetical protein